MQAELASAVAPQAFIVNLAQVKQQLKKLKSCTINTKHVDAWFAVLDTRKGRTNPKYVNITSDDVEISPGTMTASLKSISNKNKRKQKELAFNLYALVMSNKRVPGLELAQLDSFKEAVKFEDSATLLGFQLGQAKQQTRTHYFENDTNYDELENQTVLSEGQIDRAIKDAGIEFDIGILRNLVGVTLESGYNNKPHTDNTSTPSKLKHPENPLDYNPSTDKDNFDSYDKYDKEAADSLLDSITSSLES